MSDVFARVGGLKSSHSFKAPVKVATTGNIDLRGEQTIDGIAVVELGADLRPDRVLVKDQDDATQNGIYDVSSGPWSRSPDFDGNDDIRKGTRVYVHSGAAGIGEYLVTTADPIVVDTSEITFTGTAFGSLLLEQLGIGGATPDATNKLSVNSPAVLFNHDGAGSQVKVNKAVAGDTASHLFQTGFSTRAEIGLVGDDDFQFKVSPDGSSFFTGIRIDKDTGHVSFPLTDPGLKDYGAAGDGTADDTASITAADATSVAKYAQPGIYDTTLAASALDGPYWGWGQIRDTDDHLRAPWFSNIKAAPSSEGSDSSVITAFDGDLSKSLIQAEVRVTGAATLGEPATGYKYNPELAPFRLFLFNSSGHNESTTADDGRTNVSGWFTNIFHAGRGDAIGHFVRVFVSGDESSGTSWPANPSGGAYHCGITAGHDAVNLNPFEAAVDGSTFDVSGFGYVANLTRNDDTAARGEWWGNFLARSRGTEPVDVAFTASGLYDFGLDLVHGTYTNNAAITLKPDDRIYFEGVADATGAARYPSALGDTYMSYASGSSLFNIVVNNQSALQLSNLLVLSPLSIKCRGGTAIPAGGTAGVGFTFSSATNFGIFFGSGAPTLAAAVGSIYLRSDGAANTRLYSANSAAGGAGAWSAITSA